LLSAGWLGLLPERWRRPGSIALALAMVAAAVLALSQVILPAYPTVPLPKWRLWLLPRRTDVVFGDRFRLRAYDVRREPDGARVQVTLYWQAAQAIDFDYSAFVHLVDASQALLAQQDHAPGEDRRYPPTAWLPGDLVADPHWIAIPPGVDLRACRLRVGMYNWQTGQQLLVTAGEGRGSAAVLLAP
jgi:hypothetical protein